MIPDKYWKKDLSKQIKKLRILSKYDFTDFPYLMHCVQRSFLYSAIIVRKIIEDARMAIDHISTVNNTYNLPFPLSTPDFKVLQLKLEVLTYQYIGNDLFPNQLFSIDDYVKHGKRVSKYLDFLCNQIIHSYILRTTTDSKSRSFSGILVSSDREKTKQVYFISIHKWVKCLEKVYDEIYY